MSRSFATVKNGGHGGSCGAPQCERITGWVLPFNGHDLGHAAASTFDLAAAAGERLRRDLWQYDAKIARAGAKAGVHKLSGRMSDVGRDDSSLDLCWHC